MGGLLAIKIMLFLCPSGSDNASKAGFIFEIRNERTKVVLYTRQNLISQSWHLKTLLRSSNKLPDFPL